jgi:hypothetical protein
VLLESGSVSYGKATPYLPVVDLLKGYFRVHDRDTRREMQEKLTGKILALDRTLEPTQGVRVPRMAVPSTGPLYRVCSDSWSRMGLIIADMTYQGWDVQFTAYAARAGARTSSRRASRTPSSAGRRGSRRRGARSSGRGGRLR